MAVDETPGQGNAAEFQAHRRNYASFTKLIKWSAIAAAIVGFIVMLIISD